MASWQNHDEDMRAVIKGYLDVILPPLKPASIVSSPFWIESILPDNMLVNIALDDAFDLGILSSRIHVVWALCCRWYV